MITRRNLATALLGKPAEAEAHAVLEIEDRLQRGESYFTLWIREDRAKALAALAGMTEAEVERAPSRKATRLP